MCNVRTWLFFGIYLWLHSENENKSTNNSNRIIFERKNKNGTCDIQMHTFRAEVHVEGKNNKVEENKSPRYANQKVVV